MGVSPWKTPFELWEEKTGRAKREETSNFIQERGNELEPIARARYELEFDIEMPPALCQHQKHEWMRASMDGHNPALKRGLEIKYIGENDFKLAVELGKIPEKYFPQIQHQFMVTGAEQIDFYGYTVPKGAENHQGKSVTVPVFPDLNYVSNLFEAEYRFWMHIVSDVPPPFVQQDYKLIRVKGAKALADEYAEKVLLLESDGTLLPRVSQVTDELMSMAQPGPRYRIGNLLIENGIITVKKAWN